MAAKKKVKTAPKLPEKTTLKENISEYGSLKLSDTQRLTLNWEGAELRSIKANLRLKASELDLFLKRIDPQGVLRKLQSELSSMEEAAKIREEKFLSSCREVASALKMDPSKKWSYDDITGIVHLEEPVSSSG